MPVQLTYFLHNKYRSLDTRSVITIGFQTGRIPIGKIMCDRFSHTHRMKFPFANKALGNNLLLHLNTMFAHFFPFFIALCTKSIAALAGCDASSSANTKHSCSRGFCGLRTTIPKHLKMMSKNYYHPNGKNKMFHHSSHKKTKQLAKRKT